jgi:hypothetical protein
MLFTNRIMKGKVQLSVSALQGDLTFDAQAPGARRSGFRLRPRRANSPNVAQAKDFQKVQEFRV